MTATATSTSYTTALSKQEARELTEGARRLMNLEETVSKGASRNGFNPWLVPLAAELLRTIAEGAA